VAVAGGADPKKSDELLSKAVNALLKVTVLRAKAAEWLMTGCAVLLKPIEGEGRNLIRKGWQQLYIEPALAPGFVAAAYERRRAREVAATEAEVQRRVAAAAAGASFGGAAHAPSELDALIEQVKNLEAGLHEAEVPARQPRRQGAGKARKSRADERACASKVAGGDGDADTAPASGGGGAAKGGKGSGLALDGLSLKQLQTMCAAKDLAQYGTKAKLMERLRAWTPGAARSKRGRKEGQAASGAPAKKPSMLADDEPEEAGEADADEEADEADEDEARETDEDEDESESEQVAAMVEAVNGES